MAELVALGVASEVIVIIDDEYFGAGAKISLEEIGGGESRDAATDDHEVVFLGGIDIDGRIGAVATVPSSMGVLERTRILTAQAGQRRRVVSISAAEIGRRLFGGERRTGLTEGTGCRHPNQASRHAIDEITARYRAIHSEVLFFAVAHGKTSETPGARRSGERCQCTVVPAT